MKAFQTVTSKAAHLPIANIDTDMIIPKQYLKTVQRSGLGNHLFAELRYDDANNLMDDFILNQLPCKHAKILITGENFGCGSSREHAVWSLLDFGIQVIIAPSFADIFYSNCFKNGLLPIVLPSKDIERLVDNNQTLTVDLVTQCICCNTLSISFSIEAWRKEVLIKGLDEIGDTLLFERAIADFEKQQSIEKPWLFIGENTHA